MAQDHVLATTLFVTDMDKKPAMNDAWAEWFTPTAVPARATIQIETLGERRLFEVPSPSPLVIWLRTAMESSDSPPSWRSHGVVYLGTLCLMW